MKKLLLGGLFAATIVLQATTAVANDTMSIGSHTHDGTYTALDHAPIGVMGDHMHKKGEWMLSYRFMQMHMEDNRDGTSRLSPEDIATTVPNRFFGNPMQPPTLRVVPTEMTTDMHMIGGMYAPTDDLTLMAMVNYIDREMDHITFQGGMGTTQLGTFTTRSKGFGDTKLSGLYRLYDNGNHNAHLNMGISLPTGSIDEEDDVLTPMGGTPTLRMPYAMQLGSGTYDLMPGITYNGRQDRWGWGAQANATLRLGRNNEDYSWGNKYNTTAWLSYLFTPAVSGSFRLSGEYESQIDGIDDQIVAPVQTADPKNFGGKRISGSVGLNTVIPTGTLAGHRFSAELTLPVYQNLNGPQLERDHAFMIGWQKSF